MSIISFNSSSNSKIGTYLKSARHEDSKTVIYLIVEIDAELTEIFKVKGKAQFPKSQCIVENVCVTFSISNINKKQSKIVTKG